MVTRVAITGFGRIGRLTTRGIIESKRQDIKIVALNISGSIENAIHLLKYDTIHGRFQGSIKNTRSTLNLGTGSIKVFSERDPRKLPWDRIGVDVLMECTGSFNSKEASSIHLDSGAKKVLISAPAKNADLTVVYGINHQKLRKTHKIVSNASCTTNALAPVIHILDHAFGIQKGSMTAIHAYTGDQKLIDNNHKDLRRARAAGESIIPTSTGAARSIGLIIPHLDGKLDGTAIRVPTPNVSMIDCVLMMKQKVTVEQVNATMQKSAKNKLKAILGICDEPLVSADFNHQPYSAIFDCTQTRIISGNLLRVVAWYDNEWGFSLRMADTAAYMGRY